MSTGPFTEIPLIDLGPYFAGGHADRQRVAGEVNRACERIGFFLISGHGVDLALCERARVASRAFFDLPLEEKLAIRQRQDDKATGATSRSAPSTSRRRLAWRRRPI